MAEPKPTPTLESLVAGLKSTLRDLEVSLVVAHIYKFKWAPTGFQRIGPLYRISDATRTAFWSFDTSTNAPLYLGESVPDDLLAGIRRVYDLKVRVDEIQLELRATRALFAKRLTEHGMTSRQAGSALDLTHTRVLQLVNGDV